MPKNLNLVRELAPVILCSLVILTFVYYLRLCFPSNHQIAYQFVHENSLPKREDAPLDDHYIDFMEVSGFKMLRVDAWEEKMAWQRLQDDLLLRSHRQGRLTDRADSDDLRLAIAALCSIIPTVGNGEDPLEELQVQEDTNAAGYKNQRKKLKRPIEELLVDRIDAMFSLSPDHPQAYNGIQIPYSLRDFQVFMTGFLQQRHGRSRRKDMVKEIRDRRSSHDIPIFPTAPTRKNPFKDDFKEEDDYIAWAANRYWMYSRNDPNREGKTS